MRKTLKKVVWMFLYGTRNLGNLFFDFREVAIFCYHSIGDASNLETVSGKTLEEQLVFLTARGHSFVSLKEVVEYVRDGKKVPHKAVCLTFDDGYADFETEALPILRKFQIPATVFIVGEEDLARKYLGNKLPILSEDAIDRLRKDPLVTIGYHSRTHADLRTLPTHMIESEVLPQHGEVFFAYPGGNYSVDAIECLKKVGYKAAFSIKSTLITRASNPFLLPRNVITKDMLLWQVHARTTKAVEWYRKLSQI
jgi:peptidoglycan/xylan/chitin deacetylase (PgdA/CDA1 family)